MKSRNLTDLGYGRRKGVLASSEEAEQTETDQQAQ
jgi:hypothetical protein